MPSSQADIASWFDQTYRDKGLRYLRPFDAYPIFLQLLGAQPGQAILDLACGAGWLLRAAHQKQLRAVGLDLSHQGLRLAQQQAPDAGLVRGNSQSLPFADASFDLVTCIGSLERFMDRDEVLLEVQRVARPDARFCFMVRNAATMSWRVWRQWLGRQNHQGHQDALSLDEWRALFAESGFEVQQVYPDQWVHQRVRKVLRGFRRPNFGKAEPVARGPMKFAHEFVFVLTRARGQ